MLTALLVTALYQTLSSSGKPADAPDARWGHEPYAVASPLDVAVHPGDGRIFIADTHANRVVVLSPAFADAGAPLAIRNPVALDVAADGTVAVLTGGDRPGVTLLDAASLKPVREFGAPGAVPGQFAFPLGVSFDAAGNIFVFDTGNRRVQVFDATGQFVFEFGAYTWTRRYHSEKQGKDVEEPVDDRLTQPVRGDFLPDGRLVIADMRGPLRDPERGRHGGMFSVWRVDVGAKTGAFERFAKPDDPYPDFGAGDVCVDRGTGRIFYAESDFPLTDHDFVMVSDAVDHEPRYRTNFFPYRFLVHPRGVAVANNGDLVVADADRGAVFAIPRRLFDTPVGEKDPLEWPRILRVPVCERERIVLEYTTLELAPSRVEFGPLPAATGGKYSYPQPPGDGRRVVTAPAFDAQGRELPPDQPGVFHRVELTGLSPGTRYAYRFLVGDKSWPRPGWSETYLTATAPPAGKTQYLDAEVIILLFTNLITRPTDPGLRPDPPDPGPMTDEEIAGVKERLEWSRRFYWINSRCKFNLRFKYVIESDRYEPGPAEEWGYYSHADHRRIDAILDKHGVRHADCAGLCMIYGYRHWDAHQGKWVLSGSGGNTWGSVHDGSGMTAINAGDDTCWLFTHEYGHQMSINYLYSGQVYHFNHFHWNYLPTYYGAHYDGNAAIAREFSDAAYWSNKYGRLRVVNDADADGIPDDDPDCCLDERRFNSDPSQYDSDADGLSDLEELMSTAGLAHYAGAFGMRQVEPVFEPNPREIDTDGDGARDAADEYPLYPISTSVYRANVKVDGNISAFEWPTNMNERHPAEPNPRAALQLAGGTRGFSRVTDDPQIKGDLRLAWNDDYLFVGLVQQAPRGDELPARLYMELDANCDGHTVGADNIVLRADPRPDGAVTVSTQHNDTIIRMKPVWRDNVLPNPRDVPARWSRQGGAVHMEIAIPRTKDAGLDLTRFERLGVMFELEIQVDDRPRRLRLFEPQELVRVTLR